MESGVMESGLVPGALVDGKYRIHRLIGRGGMGAVYEGENVRIGRRVAIKILHSTAALDPKIVRRFEREAQAVARIGSHHVADVLDVGELETGDRFMVMEFLKGESLAERIATHGLLPPADVVGLAVQLLDGLVVMHDAGIIHRDLKPGNIFLAESDAGDFVKILDFGICKFRAAMDPQWTTAGSTVLGTPGYLSPEQLTSDEVDCGADLYALGVVIYRCVAGRLPYAAGTKAELLLQIRNGVRIPVLELVPDLDEPFASIVMKAIANEPSDRFSSAREYRDALLGWLEQAEQREGLLADFLGRPRKSGAGVARAAQPPRFTTDRTRATSSGPPSSTSPRSSKPELAGTTEQLARGPSRSASSEDRASTAPVQRPAFDPPSTAAGEERATAITSGPSPSGVTAGAPPALENTVSAEVTTARPPRGGAAVRSRSRVRAIVIGAAVGVAGALIVYELIRP